MRFVLVHAMLVFALQIVPTLLCTFWEYPWTRSTSFIRPYENFSATSVHACLKKCFEENCAVTYFIKSRCYLVTDGDSRQKMTYNELKNVETKGLRYYTFARNYNATNCQTIKQSIGNGVGR